MIFILKSSIIILALFSFYKAFLSKESFYKINRIFLLMIIAAGCILPFISIPKISNVQGSLANYFKYNQTSASFIEDDTYQNTVENNNKPHSSTQNKMESNPQTTLHIEKSQANKPVTGASLQASRLKDTFNFLWYLYLFGALVLLINLIGQIINILLSVSRSEDKIIDSEGTIINLKDESEPCSFFNFIFINPSTYDYTTYEQILSHEKIHVSKKHSIDLLLSEIAVIVFWFNPIVWLLRREIEKNLEYQTDDILINLQNEDRKNYQMNLLKIACNTSPLAITTNYNQSLIKQRILRMNSKKSNSFSYWKYAFSLPLIFSLIIFLNEPTIAVTTSITNSLENPKSIKNKNDHSTILVVNEKINPALDVSNKNKDAIDQAIELAVKATNKKVKKNHTGDCTEFEKAVALGDLEKVKELIKTLNPDCLKKAKSKPRSSPKKSKRNTPKQKDTTQKSTKKSSYKNLESPCLAAAEAAKQFDYMRLREILVYDDLTCLEYDDKSNVKDILLSKKLLELGANLIIEGHGMITIENVNLTIKPDGYEYDNCDDPEWEKLKQAIKAKNTSRIRAILRTYTPACAIGKVHEKNFEFIRFLMDFDPRIYRTENNYITVGGIGISIDLSSKLDSNEDTADQDIQEYSCVNLIDAIKKGKDHLAMKIIDDINVNCFHRETHTQTGPNGSSTSTQVSSPLIEAVKLGNHTIGKYLLENDADANFKADKTNNETPLIVAVKFMNLSFVKLLIDHGAEVSYKDASGLTALEYAIRSKNEPIISYLKSK